MILTLLFACTTDPTDSAGTDTAADADTASDGDTADSDTDSGTDTGPDRDGDGAADARDCAPDDAARSPDFAQVCGHIDTDCDGTVFDIAAVHLSESWYASTAGTNLSERTYDADGYIHRIRTGTAEAGYTNDVVYTRDGALLRTIEWADASGTLVRRDSYSYDDQDRVVRLSVDSPLDGTEDVYQETEWAADGSSVVSAYSVTGGVATLSTVAEIDPQGTTTRYEYWSGGVVTTVYAYTNEYDDDDNLIYRVTDAGDDGPDQFQDWTYTDGLLTQAREDYTGDGAWDAVYDSTYDELGNNVSYVTTCPTSAGSCRASTYTLAYDTHSRITDHVVDLYSDGSPDESFVYTYPSDTVQERVYSLGDDPYAYSRWTLTCDG